MSWALRESWAVAWSLAYAKEGDEASLAAVQLYGATLVRRAGEEEDAEAEDGEAEAEARGGTAGCHGDAFSPALLAAEGRAVQ